MYDFLHESSTDVINEIFLSLTYDMYSNNSKTLKSSKQSKFCAILTIKLFITCK